MSIFVGAFVDDFGHFGCWVVIYLACDSDLAISEGISGASICLD